MRLLQWTAILVVCLAACSCRRADLRTVKIHVPAMKNEACAQVVRRSVARVKAVRNDSISIDLETREVTVTYDSVFMSLKNVEFTIAAAGFAANDVPADRKAADALPAECR